MAFVQIILLNWNGTADTLECLESLQGLTYPNYEVLVIDNGSLVPCTSVVTQRFPRVEVIELANNRGFAGGNNVGMRVAMKRGADYVWLLNNDTVVDPAALTELVNAVEGEKSYGIVGSKIYFFGNDRVIDHAGCEWDPKRIRATHIGLREIDVGQYDELRTVQFVDGCSLLAKRQVIEDAGLLDDSFFAYLEDLDWCTRARQRGWEVVYVPKSVVHHKGGTIDEPAPYQHYLYSRNILRCVSKHHPLLLPLALLQWARDCMIGPIVHGKFQRLPIYTRSFSDWLRHRGGPPPASVFASNYST